ncbi:cleft lip and palate transmembrane 1 [Ascobolus immersus RN42]|uniref:Cleft lip and palate transmembrane 1 n=1 Tax=Ascobolus immersus RN42 TaxID=1160509 RepID=A0A3N4HXI5_ASCIM|nr:cleft lip and palate transmembrane 1 [Ascobolus immersus RN42]
MADVQRRARPAGGQPAQGAPAQQEEGVGSFVRSAIHGILIFFAIQYAAGLLGLTGDKKAAPQPFDAASSPDSLPKVTTNPDGTVSEPAYQHHDVPVSVFPMWPIESTPLDIAVYLSESFILPPLDSDEGRKMQVFEEKNFDVGTGKDERLVSLEVPISQTVKRGGMLFAHVLVGKHGSVLDPSSARFRTQDSFRLIKPLVKFMPKKKVVKTKHLLGNKDEDKEVEEKVEEEPVLADEKGQVAPYWYPNVTMQVVQNSGVVNYRQLPPPMRQYVVLDPTSARDASGANGWYYPIVFINEFWHLKTNYIEINNTVSTLPLNIDLSSIPWWKFQIYATMDESFKQQANNPTGASTGGELEQFKQILMDTNIYLLATTFIVSILHMIFEGLAFKNDISHWRNKKDNVGISVRTILANVFMQTVILLYLIDNNENTSWMILGGQAFGIVLEAWKITKTVDVKVGPSAPGSMLPWSIKFEDKHKLSDLEKETKEYDEIAFKYLYIVAVPLLLAYAVYSLIYETHKSWYSFVITTLVGSVYAYGFLMMVPSLYINYRLKSVAHMPRKAMMYKFLNTFIDDLFAFTIKMPTLHRLATLRDDVIFFVYLYQAYYYRVDPKRVNEFGQGGEDDEPVEGAEGIEGAEKKKEITAAGEEPEPVEKREEVEVVEASAVEVEGREGLRKRGE